ncbi:hypothetical protein QUW57_13370 [Phocaeicola plebeius]|uniref:hypothetical protein n=1 Tax=Phocaeicola plebeius TaxID=310297 RepID=UPI0025A49E54|nr:hypothetical protein [Phocaeicola plebeius]MDM8287559.1 hypothetical protein [Phocaeicola plebeius]
MKELRLQFISIDDWNRPVFKDEKGRYFGDTENLFNYGTGKEDVYNFYKDKELHEHIYFFGMSFNCEPEGIKIKQEVKIILE